MTVSCAGRFGPRVDGWMSLGRADHRAAGVCAVAAGIGQCEEDRRLAGRRAEDSADARARQRLAGAEARDGLPACADAEDPGCAGLALVIGEDGLDREPTAVAAFLVRLQAG